MRKLQMFYLLAALVFSFRSFQAHAMEQIRIAVYGDSLTSGYQIDQESAFPYRLEQKLRRVGFDNFKVLNLSLPAQTSGEALQRLGSVLRYQPHIVILQLGSNDAMRGINPNLIYGNISAVISSLREQNIYIVLAGVRAPPSAEENYRVQWAQNMNQLAKFAHGGYYPDILDGIIGRADLTLADGYHPNGKGVDVMVEGMYRMVDAAMRWKLEDLRYQQEYRKPEQMPMPSFSLQPPKQQQDP